MFSHLIKKSGLAWQVALLALVLSVPQLAFAAPIAVQATPAEAAARALRWVKTQQQPNGSFAGLGAGSTVDAVLAIEAAGQDPATFSSGGKTPVDFLQSKISDFAKTPGSAGKLLLAASSLAEQRVDTNALLDSIGRNYPPSGHYGQDTIGHAFAMLGLAAARVPMPPKAVQYLRSVQGADGGWSFSGDTAAGSSDTDTTAVAVQALVSAGVPATDSALQKALAYLTSQANDDGGFPYQKGSPDGGESDVNSTAYVTQALLALHADASKPIAFLLSMQKADGAFQWTKSQPDDNAGATYQAIPAILGVTLVPRTAGQTPAPGPASAGQPVPGMPTTGSAGSPLPGLVVLIVAAILLGCGLTLRRRTAI